MEKKAKNCPYCGRLMPTHWKNHKEPEIAKKDIIKHEGVKCPRCGGSRIWKNAKRYTPIGVIKRYYCRDCVYRFSKQ